MDLQARRTVGVGLAEWPASRMPFPLAASGRPAGAGPARASPAGRSFRASRWRTRKDYRQSLALRPWTTKRFSATSPMRATRRLEAVMVGRRAVARTGRSSNRTAGTPITRMTEKMTARMKRKEMEEPVAVSHARRTALLGTRGARLERAVGLQK